MRLAILVTNTDDSAFAQRHPKDDAKFTDMVHSVRPDWACEAFWVKDGVFPDALDRFDGLILTGSPASVHDDADWIGRLLDLIRSAHDQHMPMFGACFGHQAIALALGGTVVGNPNGWVHQLTDNEIMCDMPWTTTLPRQLRLYGSHVEQVGQMPDGAVRLTASEDAVVTGFSLGTTIYTTQHHPEMTPAFFAALTDEMSEKLGAAGTERARQSLSKAAHTEPFAQSVARFFEQSRERG